MREMTPMCRTTKTRACLFTSTLVVLSLGLARIGGSACAARKSVGSDHHVTEKEERAFDVAVDEKFDRPVWRRTPPIDRNHEKPLDVVKRFLDSINKGDSATARELCRSTREGLGPFPSVGEELFPTFCETMRREVKTVTLSGSTIKGKSGYWFIRYRLKTRDGREREGTFYLMVDSKKWKIEEKSHWRDIAKGQDEGVPGW